jgi:hypothetical protein
MRRPSPALVISCLALFLSGAGGAVAAVQISGKQIKDGTITGKDIKNDSLTGSDIKGNIRGPEGPRGAQGAQGPQGATGSGAPVGLPAGASVSYRTGGADIDPDDADVPVEAICPSGQVAIGGGYTLTPSLVVDESTAGGEPSRPDRWRVVVDNLSDQELGTVFVDVICIAPGDVSGFPPQ